MSGIPKGTIETERTMGLGPIQPGAVNEHWQTQLGQEDTGLPLVALAHGPCSGQS